MVAHKDKATQPHPWISIGYVLFDQAVGMFEEKCFLHFTRTTRVNIHSFRVLHLSHVFKDIDNPISNPSQSVSILWTFCIMIAPALDARS